MSFFLLMTRREAATRRRTIKIDGLASSSSIKYLVESVVKSLKKYL